MFRLPIFKPDVSNIKKTLESIVLLFQWEETRLVYYLKPSLLSIKCIAPLRQAGMLCVRSVFSVIPKERGVMLDINTKLKICSYDCHNNPKNGSSDTYVASSLSLEVN